MFNNKIDVAKGFQTSVNIAYDLNNTDKISGFIPTMSSLEIIEDVLLSTAPNSTERARILIGAYGRGKSHIILVLLSLLYKKDKVLFAALLEKMKICNPKLYDYTNEFIDSGRKLLPIVVGGSSASLTQSFLFALQKALDDENLSDIMPETHFKASVNAIESWKNDYPETYNKFLDALNEPIEQFILSLKEYNVEAYEKFVELYPSLTSGSSFNPFLGFDVVELYEKVVDKLCEVGYDGAYIVYDEFSKYLESSIGNATISDIKLLQDFAEKCVRSGKKQMHLKVFNNNAHSYFAKKMISDALSQLAAADKIDTGIPYIHAKTIEFLIKRKKCICGADIEFGNEAYKELNELLEFIPPQSIGTSIGQFVRECELRCKSSDTLFEDISTKFGFIREFDNTYTGYQNQINIIREKLEKMKNVGELQARLSTYERALRNLSVERRELDRNQALLERDKERRETERKELSLKDENNRKIEVYKAYAQYMYTTLLSLYQEKENETRQKLEQTVNEIFKSIYNGGFSLSIDEKYNIQVIVNEFEGVNEDVETSTAQSISVIFAFIAGVIKMARQSQNPENEMLVSEPYPLVMDAPLSAFDKARIRTVCDALPNVAEQVIIFIKDTDGELAETYMGDKVGSRFEFDKKNEFETNLVTR